MSLWRTYYHLVWSTKNRHPFITAEIEPELYRHIESKTSELASILHVIGGIEDHIHLLVSIPPKLAVSTFVQTVKGSSTHYLNHLDETNPAFKIQWQRGFGVFSLGKQQLSVVGNYILNQKQHHKSGKLIQMLENLSDKTSPPKKWGSHTSITRM